jgi:hypothetical protein
MGQSFVGIVMLAPLALLGACLQVPPRSSVPFQATADRQTRYAAEITLAVKEDRRGEVSEAVANGRMVLPQLPEIWALPRVEPGRPQAALEPGLGQLEPVAASGLVSVGCASLRGPWLGDASPADCRQGWRPSPLVLPPPGYASIAPAAAPFDP